MVMNRALAVMVIGSCLGAALLAGCSSGGNQGTGTSTSTTRPHTTGTSGAAASSTSSSSSTSSTTVASSSTSTPGSSTTSSTAVQNLTVTDTLRSQLLAAGAAAVHLSPSDYTGLVPGLTYYAYDPSTGTYWAGAALLPSPSSQEAQVTSQDDGSYLLFTQTGGGPWNVLDVGATGGTGGAPCPAVPAAVVAIWNWTPGTCKPQGA
jgi:cytoskeletal protein RodZ